MLQNMPPKSRLRDGFSLTEMIVVAVIVALLAAVAIPTYLGFISDAKVSEANAIGKSCATYVSTARNSGLATIDITGFAPSIAPATLLRYTSPDGDAITFLVPDKATITVTGSPTGGGTVMCTFDGKPGTVFPF